MPNIFISETSEITIKHWNGISSPEDTRCCVGNRSEFYLVVSLEKKNKLRFSVKCDYYNRRNQSVYCKLCLIDKHGKVRFTEKKKVYFEDKHDDAFLTEWSTDGVKKFIKTTDLLIIRCTISALKDGEVFDGTMRTETSYTAGNRRFLSRMRKLSTDFKALLENKNMCDVVLKVGEEHFSAHKSILSARSQVFAAMFEHNMKENATGAVTIDDLEPPIVEVLLQFAYAGEVTGLKTENISEVYAAADKYAFMGLKEICIEKMLEGLSEDNFCTYLLMADIHSDKMLKDGVIGYILIHGYNFLSDNWKDFCRENPHVALEVYHEFATFKVADCSILSSRCSE